MAKAQAACPPPNSPANSARYRMLAQKGAVPVTSHGQITGRRRQLPRTRVIGDWSWSAAASSLERAGCGCGARQFGFAVVRARLRNLLARCEQGKMF